MKKLPLIIALCLSATIVAQDDSFPQDTEKNMS